MVDLFVVVRMGVYDQGVVAVTGGLNGAKSAAENAAKGEHDLYHDFEIRKWSHEFGEYSQAIRRLSADRRAKARTWSEVPT